MFTLNLLLCFLGICYGSFVGSYIVRFPRIIDPESNITMSCPRSKCESCGEILKVHMLIPLLSYLVQKGKCAYCRKSISTFYFINELMHLILIALMLWANIFSSPIELLILFLVISSLYVQFILDLKHLLLSVYLSIKILILGLVINYSGFFTDIQSAVVGLMAGYLSLFLINKVFYYFRKKEGIGGGDFILLASIGALLGYQMLSFVVLLGSLFSLLIYLFKRSNFDNRVPFGSGLALSTLLIILIKISVV